MTDYTELIRSLRNCSNNRCTPCDCGWFNKYQVDESCKGIIMWKAAAAIEALQAEVQFYNALAEEWKSSAENKERLLRLYRAEQAKHFYSAMDDNGRIIANPCVCMNIPVFPDSSEIPNS